MSVFLARGRMRIAHTEDPKEAILKRLPDLSGMQLFYNSVLTAVYEIPKDAKTVSGLIVPDKTRNESIWQGRTCLVLKLGPTAFKDEGDVKFYGQRVDVGDWIMTRASDGQSLEIGDVVCRLYRDTQVLAKLPDPDFVW